MSRKINLNIKMNIKFKFNDGTILIKMNKPMAFKKK